MFGLNRRIWGGIPLNVNKKIGTSLFLIGMLLPSISYAGDSITQPNVYACGVCSLKVPEDKVFPYSINAERIWDNDGNFIGFKSIEKKLASAGIKDYKIVSQDTKKGNVLFNIVSNDKNKSFISSIIFNEVDEWPEEVFDETIINGTRAENDCKKKAYDSALREFNEAKNPKFSYYSDEPNIEGKYNGVKGTYDIKVCFNAEIGEDAVVSDDE